MYLDVPFITQLGFGINKNSDDPTGCWYASACMVNYFFEAGPRQGVPELYTRPIVNADGSAGTGHWGLAHEWLKTFMKREHLAVLIGGLPKKTEKLERRLRKWGPLLVFWFKTAPKGGTYGHASVVIGTSDKGEVIYHDPENAPNSRMDLATFVTKLYPHKDYPTLRPDRPAYIRKRLTR